MAGVPSLDVRAVRGDVAGTRFADVRWVDETGSTNADLMELAQGGGPEGIVLGADHQLAGRGRRGRTWVAAPGRALLVSVLLRPPSPAVDLVMPAAALAAVDAVARVTGTSPSIKWPNDLVARSGPGQPERKLAGLLAEAAWPPGADAASGWRPLSPSERVAVVVGLGLNVSSVDRPPDLAPIAVACDELGADDVTRQPILVAWLHALDRWYADALELSGRERLWDAWRERSATLGRRVRVELGSEDVEGIATDVTATGQLIVRADDGTERTLAVGDVTHLRTVDEGEGAIGDA
jgi:BirA family biotin operon repressor/biotin-[acetyl-CoA-carboxylase] ligase